MRFLLTTVLLLITSAPSRADTPATSAPAPDRSQPITRIALPDLPSLGKAVFSKDGHRIFVQQPKFKINVWEVFTYYWPEALGAVFGLTAIVCFFAMVRVVRSKRIPGLLHCRKCNYCLHESKSDRCSECNHPTRHAVKGRPQWRRLLPWSCSVAVLSILYACLWMANVPRSGWMSNAVELWSESLMNWGVKRNYLWLVLHSKRIGEIAEYDTRTGIQTRVLSAIGARHPYGFPILECTPDGSALLVPYKNDSLAIVSTESGELISTLDCPEVSLGSRIRWQPVVAFDSQQIAYLTAVDEKQEKTKLIAWNWRADRHEVLLETAAYVSSGNSQKKSVRPRQFAHMPDAGKLRFLEIPVNRESDPQILVHEFPESTPTKCGVSSQRWYGDPQLLGGNELIVRKQFG
jgi:hypothetical protein